MPIFVKNISFHEKGRVRRTKTPTNVIDFYVGPINITRLPPHGMKIADEFYERYRHRFDEAERLGLLEIIGAPAPPRPEPETEAVEEKEKETEVETPEETESEEKPEEPGEPEAVEDKELTEVLEDDGVPEIGDLAVLAREDETKEVKQPKKRGRRKKGGK